MVHSGSGCRVAYADCGFRRMAPQRPDETSAGGAISAWAPAATTVRQASAI